MTARTVAGLQMGNRTDRRDREGRLAEALRANLRRRKAQARNRREQPDDGGADHEADQRSGDQDSRNTSTAETERD